MKYFIFFLSIVAFVSLTVYPQAIGVSAADNFGAEKEFAKLTFEAHGGEKLKTARSITIIGSVDVTAASFPQPIPATFLMIFAGNNYRVEINNPFQPLKQAFDGTQTLSSLPNGFSLPPFNRVGFPVLQRLRDPGFVITSVPENKKKRKAFRLTTPEGYVTDFYLDEKTNQVKSYESVYPMNGRTVKTSVEVDKNRLVEGVTIPEKYVQRFDLDQLTFYAAFNAKQITLNNIVEADVFTKIN